MGGGHDTDYIASPPLPHILCTSPSASYELFTRHKASYDSFVELCAANGGDINGRIPELSGVVFGLLPDRFQDSDTREERFSTLLQLLAVLVYGSKILQLGVDWDKLRYEAILSPSNRLFQSLIGLRRQITDIHRDLNPDLLRAEVPKPAKRFIGMGTERGFDLVGLSRRLNAYSVDHGYAQSVLDWVTRLAQETEKMEDDLNDDIQLAIGAATIQDSDAMKQQAEKGTLLTTLAALYLPLTLVTGIFGMNIREISRGEPRFWWCLVTLFVINLATTTFVLVYKDWTRFRKFIDEEIHRAKLTSFGILVSRVDFAHNDGSLILQAIKFLRWKRK